MDLQYYTFSSPLWTCMRQAQNKESKVQHKSLTHLFLFLFIAIIVTTCDITTFWSFTKGREAWSRRSRATPRNLSTGCFANATKEAQRGVGSATQLRCTPGKKGGVGGMSLWHKISLCTWTGRSTRNSGRSRRRHRSRPTTVNPYLSISYIIFNPVISLKSVWRLRKKTRTKKKYSVIIPWHRRVIIHLSSGDISSVQFPDIVSSCLKNQRRVHVRRCWRTSTPL